MNAHNPFNCLIIALKNIRHIKIYPSSYEDYHSYCEYIIFLQDCFLANVLGLIIFHKVLDLRSRAVNDITRPQTFPQQNFAK